MLCQDDFPNAEEDIPRIKDRIDWEHPDSIHWVNWQRAVKSFENECDYLILDGLFIFRPEAGISPDLSIYLKIDKEQFTKARQQETRWGPEPNWYIDYVWQQHLTYGLPPNTIEAHQFTNIKEKDYPTILSMVKG